MRCKFQLRMILFMKPFNIQDQWIYPNIQHWTPYILKNLSKINHLYKNNEGIVLDVGGGLAPISDITNLSDYKYILLDPDINKLNLCIKPIEKIQGYAENIPLKDNSIDILITSSCLQYINQYKFFDECRRVLKVGGIIALHENGPYNPFILFARLIQRFIGLFNKEQWKYRNTIKTYYYPKELNGFELYSVIQVGLTTPILLYLQILNIKQPPKLLFILNKIDYYLLLIFPFLKKITFLSTVIYIKK